MAVLLLFFALPNALLLSASFLRSEAQQLTNELTLDNYTFLFTRPLYIWAFIRTFIVGVSVGLIDVVLGYPLAYFLVRTRTFFNVVLPLSFPGLAGGFILAFSIAISAYATPAILGGPATQVMATAIYGFMTQLLDWSIGAALAVVLVFCAVLLTYAATRFGARQAAL